MYQLLTMLQLQPSGHRKTIISISNSQNSLCTPCRTQGSPTYLTPAVQHRYPRRIQKKMRNLNICDVFWHLCCETFNIIVQYDVTDPLKCRNDFPEFEQKVICFLTSRSDMDCTSVSLVPTFGSICITEVTVRCALEKTTFNVNIRISTMLFRKGGNNDKCFHAPTLCTLFM